MKKTVAARQADRRVLVLLLWVVGFVACFVLGSLLASGLVLSLRAIGADWSVETTLGSLSFRLASYVMMGVLFFVVPVVLLKRKYLSRRDMGIGRMVSFRDIGLALAGLVVYVAATVATQFLLQHAPGFDSSQAQDLGISTTLYGGDLLLAYVVLVILTPLFEELLFRGMLYGELRKYRIGPWVASLVVSVLFGLAHGQWNVGVDVFCLSIVACYLREVTGTIWPGVVLHMIKNGVAFWFVFVLMQGVAR